MDPLSGSSIQCLAKITVMVLSRPLIWTLVGVMAAYLSVVRVCTAQCRETLHSSASLLDNKVF